MTFAKMFGAVPQTSASAASQVYQTSTQANEASHVYVQNERERSSPRTGAKCRNASNFIFIMVKSINESFLSMVKRII